MTFVNRISELARLDDWWGTEAASLGMVWGRRRVGKTALIQHFATEKRSIFHTGSQRPPERELQLLSEQARPILGDRIRDLSARPFADWLDMLDTLASAARTTPTLLVLDEFPELVAAAPELPSVLRAFWDRARGQTQLKILLCGSAVRTMEALQEERAPLFGRIDLRLLLHPFRPHEAALMLPTLSPAERALVWCLVGGVPLYLEWWDPSASVAENLEALVCTPGGRLISEGAYVLATEGDPGALARPVLYAIAGGATRFNEIESAVRGNPARTLDGLVTLRLVERVAPVTEDPRHTRRTTYRIADNFLHFWLGLIDRYRGAIERGLGPSILPVLMASLDDHVGPRWEDALRDHLRLRAANGELGDEIVAVGSFWTRGKVAVEIDAVALAGRGRRAVLLGEAKWARRVDGRRIAKALSAKGVSVPNLADDPLIAVAARDEVEHADGLLAVTAADIFGD